MPAFDLARPRRAHLVGIGGAGMRAYASVLVSMGHTVTGSDLRDSAGLDRLRGLGVTVMIGHDPANVGPAEAVATSTAIPASNVEIVEAHRRGIPVLRRAELLAAICGTRRTVAVSGTHGKTTTTSMLALILRQDGMRPSFIVGGDVNELGTGAAWDHGDWLVVEADESDGIFLEVGVEVVVVTNVEADHLDHYGSLEGLTAAFASFVDGAAGTRVLNADDPIAATIAARYGATTFGVGETADYQLVGVELARSRARFSIAHEGHAIGPIELPLPGMYNAMNAIAAVAAGIELGASAASAVDALARFGGVARRFQFRGEWNGVSFVDDYAHLPGEVASVLAAAAGGGWARVVAVFQPHRYSRTVALWQDFGASFGGAGLVVVTDVYASDEAPRPGVTGQLIAQAIAGADPDQAVVYQPSRPSLVDFLRHELRPGDLCLTLGAGDITLLADEVRAPDGSSLGRAGGSPAEGA